MRGKEFTIGLAAGLVVIVGIFCYLLMGGVGTSPGAQVVPVPVAPVVSTTPDVDYKASASTDATTATTENIKTKSPSVATPTTAKKLQNKPSKKGTLGKGVLFGTVRDTKGTALSGASVYLKAETTTGMAGYASYASPSAWATTNEKGKYRMEGLSTVDPIEITASHPTHLPTNNTILPSLNGTELNFTLVEGAKIRGIVTGPKGPVEQAMVYAKKKMSDGESPEPFQIGLSTLGKNAGVQSAKDGSYTMAGLEGGTYTLSVSTQTFKDKSVTVTVPETGEVVQHITLTIGGTISGRVIDERGGPISGISVYAYQGETEATVSMNKQSKTGDGGAFTLTGLPDGTVGLSVNDPKNLYTLTNPQDLQKLMAIEVGRTDLTITMETAGMLTGRVLDETSGEPIEGASVNYLSESNMYGFGNTRSVKSKKDGSYTLMGISSGSYTISAKAKGYGETAINDIAIITGETKSLDITLGAGSTLTGRVIDDSGAPIEGATIVRVDPKNQIGGFASEAMVEMMIRQMESIQEQVGDEQAAEMLGPFGGMQIAKSNEDGEFILKGLSEGKALYLSIQTGFTTARELVETRKGSSSEVTFVMGSGGTIHGALLDTQEKPITSAQIVVSSSRGLFRNASPKKDGTFKITGLKPGTYTVMAVSGGPMVPGGKDGRPMGSASKQGVVVAKGETTTIVLQFNKGLTVKGRLLKGTEAVSGAMIQLLDPEGGMLDIKYGQTNGEGRFTISGVKPGSYQAWIQAGTAQAKVPVVITQDSESTELNLQLPTNRIIGTILDAETGAPLANSQIMVLSSSDGSGRSGWMGLLESMQGSAQGNADGSFEISGMQSGTYQLQVTRPGYALGVIAVTIPMGGDALNQTVRMEKGVELAGKVLDPDGNPTLASLSVKDLTSGAIDMTMFQGGTRSLPDGSFTLSGLTPGHRYVIYAFSEPYAPGRAIVQVQTSGNEVELRLSQPATLRLKVIGSDGNPIEGARATLTFPDGGTVGEVPTMADIMATPPQSTDQGMLAIENLIPGRYTVKVTQGKKTGQLTVDLQTGPSIEKQIRLSGGSASF